MEWNLPRRLTYGFLTVLVLFAIAAVAAFINHFLIALISIITGFGFFYLMNFLPYFIAPYLKEVCIKEISLLVCRECWCQVDEVGCRPGCRYMNLLESERNPETLELFMYTLQSPII